ncbi:LysR family transcriptional regulator [Aliivibrio sp. S2TY2]|uniref:LysR family transcriptional regulator n=1 Tax=unclassified Aliivibrio TaxID=2645654 RepID=UPI002378B5D3|nr:MULTISPECIES: LysR family transcriptional regulator [unclassified Aliivibrio]MDD9175247.1 LysR family transcriptional regulator [Aliivibrio sp. S3TY1]MDD9192326.1 LysR family transcriptional regulator [Aliivibrio sp. S2TY2]
MQSPITLDALRALDAIDRKGSFAAAAKSLFKVPSALTYTIKKLEDDLHVILFDRSKQKAQLTSAGKLILEQGREILIATDKLESAVKQLDSGWERNITISRDTIIPLAPLLESILEFNKLEHDTNITISEESLGGGWDALHSNRTDIAIGVSDHLPKGEYQIKEIGRVDFLFAVSQSHPLALIERPIDISDLLLYPSLIVSDSSLLLPTRDTGLFKSKQQIRFKTMQAKIEAQTMGLGVGFLPRHLIKQQLNDGILIEKKCTVPRVNPPLFIAWHKDNDGKACEWFARELMHKKWL